MKVFRLLLAIPLFAAAESIGHAAIVTYSFSGVMSEFRGTPAAAVLPGVELGDPFSGTVTYDTSSYSLIGNGYWSGGPPNISILIDDTYALDATSAWESRYVESLVPPYSTLLGVSIQNSDMHGGGVGVELPSQSGVFTI